MWKLIIKQNQNDSYVTDTIELMSDDIGKLTDLINLLSGYKSKKETTYKIEKVGEEE